MKGTSGRHVGLAALLIALAATPAAAQGQAPERRFSLEAAAGFQVYYTGHAELVAFGFAPTRSLTFLISAQQSHVKDEITLYENSFDSERGGTEQFVAGELRYAFLPRKRVSPYVVVGAGGGISRPNVNEFFPDRKQREIGVFFYGAGVRMPVRPWLDAFVDTRLIMAAEAKSDFFAVRYPVRAGVAWRF